MKVLITTHRIVEIGLDSPAEWPMGMNNDHARELRRGNATAFSIGDATHFLQPFLREHEEQVERLRERLVS